MSSRALLSFALALLVASVPALALTNQPQQSAERVAAAFHRLEAAWPRFRASFAESGEALDRAVRLTERAIAEAAGLRVRVLAEREIIEALQQALEGADRTQLAALAKQLKSGFAQIYLMFGDSEAA